MVWVDCDQNNSHQQLQAFSPRPALAVASGSGGTHAYWPLDRPVGPDRLEHANRRLAHAPEGDRQSVDAARMLRPLGTLNHKHSPPQAVELRWFEEGAVVELADVLASLPELPASAAGTGAVEPRDPRGDPLLTIPHHLRPRPYRDAAQPRPQGHLSLPPRPHTVTARLRARPRMALLRLRRPRLHLRPGRPPMGPWHSRPRLPRAAPAARRDLQRARRRITARVGP